MTRRGMTLVIVLLSLSVLTTIVAGLQAISLRQAVAGREAVARCRAYWAARAGVEATLARLESSLEGGGLDSAYAIPDHMLNASTGVVPGATWKISHALTGLAAESRDGPADPHAKVNINLMTKEDLLTLDEMTEDVADSILDWIDDDDSPRPLGAESGFYSQLPSPYEPRNGPVPSLFEVELAAGVSPSLVRGEDWDLDGVLDSNEDDGDLSWPPDNADGVLDAGWSAFVTASSWEGGFAPSGQARLNLADATVEELLARVPSLDQTQAQTLLDYVWQEDARLEQLMVTSLAQIAGQGSSVRDLRDEQIRALLDECEISDPTSGPSPGRVNLNTVSRETLDFIIGIAPGVADALIVARDSAAGGFTNIMDVLDAGVVSRTRLADVSRLVGVSPGAYQISSIGRDDATGFESRIICVVGVRALPAPIVEQFIR